MIDVSKYSLFNMLKVYQNNRDKIHADIRGEKYEGFDSKGVSLYLGLSGVTLVLFIVFTIGLWLWALVALLQKYPQMPSWAIVFSVLSLISGFPLVALLITYMVK
jgi:hypothetical protein